jgi:hypothetical protein
MFSDAREKGAMPNRIWSAAVLSAIAWGCGGNTEHPAPAAAPACPRFALATAGLPDQGEWRTHPSIGDVNRDGLDDVAALGRKTRGPQVFLSDGLGRWTEASEGLRYESGFSCGVGTRLVDLDEDGLLDLLVADHCLGVRVFRGDGGSSWKEISRGIPRNLEGFNDAAAGDINGDGRLDIVAISAFSRGFLVLEGASGGSWSPRWETGLPKIGSGWQIELHDVNGDGRLDIVCTFNPVSTDLRYGPAPPAKVWLQQPDGNFRPTSGFPEEGRFFGLATLARPESRAPELFFAVSGYRAGLYAFTSSSGEDWTVAGRVDEGWLPEPQRGYAGVTTSDVDGDGCADLLATEGSFGHVLLALGDCRGSWRVCPLDTLPLPEGENGFGWGVAAGDFNGDGRADVVSGYGTKNGGLVAWLQVSRDGAEPRVQGQGPAASSRSLASGVPVPSP